MGKYIYLAGVLNNLKNVNDIICVVLFYGAAILIVFGVVDYYNGHKNGICFKIVKNKLYILALAFSLMLAVILPSKEEVYAMVITDKVLTQDNYNKSIDEAKKLIDYTINKIKEIKGE